MRENAQTRARKARERTAKWREERKAARRPEASRVDRDLLLSLIDVGKRGPTMMIDEARFREAIQTSLKLLARRYDPEASRSALADRLRDFDESTEIKTMLDREAVNQRLKDRLPGED